ncbi:hypothetical protein BCR33DRAFT_724741 [Rhizoclosmatium globosum]|uniref:Ctf8-domain-containing protein n=1 Tax=Rhizoclosmatium globosum TaxID=329046 RepID=A0A1Y2B3V1_9FUNG|nr:hypothetical protein BCR33DRAFT_724741 [Rhizoclosmatium globosum]|eukprot:ORY29230.1 hypothetical protein BCR33DRAFT_724741 [Rhizoclosmatium globosum]
MQITIPTTSAIQRATAIFPHRLPALSAVESAAGVSLGGASLGLVEFDEGTPTLIIGRHKLRGKMETLKLPLAVLRQEPGSNTDLLCVIKYKYIFSDRPVPILSEANVGLAQLAKQKR